MNTTLLKSIAQLRRRFHFPTHEDKTVRRQWLAGVLLAFLFVLALLALLDAVFYFWPFDNPDNLAYMAFVAGIAGLLGLLWVINRNLALSRFVRPLTILLLMAGILFSDSPESVIWGSSFILFALPIISSSFILSPAASFWVALAVNLEVQVFASLTFPGREIYPIYDGLSLLIVAGVAWLAAAAQEKALTDLERERKLKNLLLNSLRDEIAAPLAGIVQASATGAEGGAPNNNRSDLELEHIHRCGRLLQTRLNFLLELEDLLAETWTPEQAAIDLVPVLHSVTGLLAEQCAHKQQALLLAGLPESAYARVDRRRLEQGLGNLLGVLSELSPEDTKISIALHGHENDLWQLSVRSLDLMLPAEQLERMFQPEGRFGAARRIVEAQSGKLGFSLLPDRGAQFILQLPAGPTDG